MARAAAAAWVAVYKEAVLWVVEVKAVRAETEGTVEISAETAVVKVTRRTGFRHC